MGAFVRIGLLVGLVFAGAGGAAAEPAAKTYAEWVAMAEAGDPAVDWTALRMAYVRSPGYDGYGMGWGEARGAFLKAVNAHDCTEAIRLSQAILKADYTYPLVHLTLGNCFRKAGDQTRAKPEYDAYEGLTKSVLSSGDGKSVETAYIVVTMAEERFVLMNLNLDETAQALISKDGHNYDRIDAANPDTGERKAVYFNVDAMFGSLLRTFGGGKDNGANK